MAEKRKQYITFQRVQTVIVDFDVETPIPQHRATDWAELGYDGRSALEGMLKAGTVKIETEGWKAVSSDPPFPADPVADVKRKKRHAG